MFTKEAKHPKGAIAILTLLGVIVFALLMMTTLATLAASEARMSTADSNTTETFYAAEAGLNQALYNLITDPVPGTYNLTLDDKNITITVGPCEATDPPPCDPYHRKVEARAEDPSGKVRIVSLTASTSSFAGGFDSAVQAAAGGVFMENGSCVVGNVHSNGNISGPGSGNNGCRNTSETACRPFVYNEKHSILGKAAAALSHSIIGVDNDNDLVAHTISSSVAGKNAYYQALPLPGTVKANGLNTSPETCSLAGGTFCHAGSADVDERELPITAETLAVGGDWKINILAGGELNPIADDCPTEYSDGSTYCITADTTLGSKRINGNLYVGKKGVAGSTPTLTLDGNLWITGNIFFDNNGVIRVASTLGGLSVVVIADGIIDVNNNYSIVGNGDPRSFILMASSLDRKTAVGCNDPDLLDRPAICASNNSNSIVFAAPEGLLYVKNNGCLNASATYTIHLQQNSTVTYNPLLSYFTVGSGGGQDVGTAPGSWREK